MNRIILLMIVSTVVAVTGGDVLAIQVVPPSSKVGLGLSRTATTALRSKRIQLRSDFPSRPVAQPSVKKEAAFKWTVNGSATSQTNAVKAKQSVGVRAAKKNAFIVTRAVAATANPQDENTADLKRKRTIYLSPPIKKAAGVAQSKDSQTFSVDRQSQELQSAAVEVLAAARLDTAVSKVEQPRFLFAEHFEDPAALEILWSRDNSGQETLAASPESGSDTLRRGRRTRNASLAPAYPTQQSETGPVRSLVALLLVFVWLGWKLPSDYLGTQPEITKREQREKELEASVKNFVENGAQGSVSSPSEMHEKPARCLTADEIAEQRTIKPKRSQPKQTEPKYIQPEQIQASTTEVLGLSSPDDLTMISGIGPVAQQVLHDHGIHRFEQVAELSVEQLRGMFFDDQNKFQLLDPSTWPAQALAFASLQVTEEEVDYTMLEEVDSIRSIALASELTFEMALDRLLESEGA